jgi:hypothetical protein
MAVREQADLQTQHFRLGDRAGVDANDGVLLSTPPYPPPSVAAVTGDSKRDVVVRMAGGQLADNVWRDRLDRVRQGVQRRELPSGDFGVKIAASQCEASVGHHANHHLSASISRHAAF